MDVSARPGCEIYIFYIRRVVFGTVITLFIEHRLRHMNLDRSINIDLLIGYSHSISKSCGPPSGPALQDRQIGKGCLGDERAMNIFIGKMSECGYRYVAGKGKEHLVAQMYKERRIG